MKPLLIGILTILGFSVSDDPDYDKIILNGLTVSKAIVTEIETKTNKVFVPLKFFHWKDSIIDTTNYGHWDSTSHGIIIKDLYENEAKAIFNIYYARSTGEGNYIYLTHLHFDSLNHSFFDIAIVQAKNQLEAVKRVGTSSKNYDVSNEKVLEKLESWNHKINYKIMVIDVNRIEGYLLSNPLSMKKFTEEIYEFCPDVIDKGYGTMDAMIKYYEVNKYFWLWWD